MKPTVFNYKAFEDLRQAYKELLSDNQTLMADNRKLRAEVEELRKTNAGYTKVLAKSQDTVNKLMREVAERTPGKWKNEHEDGHGWWVGKCDQCGKENRVNNFCPNCGAIMDGGKSE